MRNPLAKSSMRIILVAAAFALGILVIGQGIWGGLLAVNLATGLSIPWSVAAMALVLWLFWKYLAGKGAPKSTSAARASLLRARAVSPRIFWLAFLAGLLSIAAFSAYWILLSQLFKVAPNVLPKISGYPVYT